MGFQTAFLYGFSNKTLIIFIGFINDRQISPMMLLQEHITPAND